MRDYSLAIGGSVLVALFIRFFLLEAYRMPSRAMQPAVEPGDTLFVSKNAYAVRIPFSEKRYFESLPKYGDVAVLEFPDEPGRQYIKRVVGLPGDRVQISKGSLLLNGENRTDTIGKDSVCKTETLPNSKSYSVCFQAPLLSTAETIVVPDGQAFVVGDFRTAPNEIRRLKTQGLVPFTGLRGRAQFVWLSIQPPTVVPGADWFSRIRFNRLFKGIH
jgi:signal peptidase I